MEKEDKLFRIKLITNTRRKNLLGALKGDDLLMPAKLRGFKGKYENYGIISDLISEMKENNWLTGDEDILLSQATTDGKDINTKEKY
eukprot:gene9192-2988_t